MSSGRPLPNVHMPAEEKERGSPEVKTQEVFIMRIFHYATHYFSETVQNIMFTEEKVSL